jgi:hypothetical protein
VGADAEGDAGAGRHDAVSERREQRPELRAAASPTINTERAPRRCSAQISRSAAAASARRARRQAAGSTRRAREVRGTLSSKRSARRVAGSARAGLFTAQCEGAVGGGGVADETTCV